MARCVARVAGPVVGATGALRPVAAELGLARPIRVPPVAGVLVPAVLLPAELGRVPSAVGPAASGPLLGWGRVAALLDRGLVVLRVERRRSRQVVAGPDIDPVTLTATASATSTAEPAEEARAHRERVELATHRRRGGGVADTGRDALPRRSAEHAEGLARLGVVEVLRPAAELAVTDLVAQPSPTRTEEAAGRAVRRAADRRADGVVLVPVVTAPGGDLATLDGDVEPDLLGGAVDGLPADLVDDVPGPVADDLVDTAADLVADTADGAGDGGADGADDLVADGAAQDLGDHVAQDLRDHRARRRDGGGDDGPTEERDPGHGERRGDHHQLDDDHDTGLLDVGGGVLRQARQLLGSGAELVEFGPDLPGGPVLVAVGELARHVLGHVAGGALHGDGEHLEFVRHLRPRAADRTQAALTPLGPGLARDDLESGLESGRQFRGHVSPSSVLSPRCRADPCGDGRWRSRGPAPPRCRSA